MGYFIACIIDYTMATSMFCYLGTLAELGVSSLPIVISIIRDLESLLKAIDRNAQNRNYSQTVENFREFIELHSSIVKLSWIAFATCSSNKIKHVFFSSFFETFQNVACCIGYMSTIFSGLCDFIISDHLHCDAHFFQSNG